MYSTFQSHEPEFDYLKSLEIEEKINKIRWLKRKNPAHFLLSTNGNILVSLISFRFNCNLLDKTIKLWKVSERDKRAEGYNLKEDSGVLRDPSSITSLRVPVLKPMELMVEASPRRIFANAHTYHINSISVNSDQVRYLGSRGKAHECFSNITAKCKFCPDRLECKQTSLQSAPLCLIFF